MLSEDISDERYYPMALWEEGELCSLFSYVLAAILFPESSGFLARGWSPGERLWGTGIVTPEILRLTVLNFVQFRFSEQPIKKFNFFPLHQMESFSATTR